MDARETISAVLGIRFPCVSLVLKVIDLEKFAGKNVRSGVNGLIKIKISYKKV